MQNPISPESASNLHGFIIYVFEHQFQNLLQQYLTQLQNAPFSGFGSLSQQQVNSQAQEVLSKQLISISGWAQVSNKIEAKYEPGVALAMQTDSSPLDISLNFSIQKRALLAILPQFTSNISIATEVAQAIELYYQLLLQSVLHDQQVLRTKESALRLQSDERYRRLFDNASDLIQVVTVDGEINYVNQSWLNTMGYTWQDLEGRPITDFVKKSERMAYVQYRQKIIEGSISNSPIQTTYISKAGQEIIIEGSITFKNGDGQVQGIFRNITEKVQQEKRIRFYTDQLAEKEENLRNIIEHAPDGVIVIDSAGKILLWNPKAEQIFGWQQGEVVGLQMNEVIIPPSLRQAHTSGMHRYNTSGEARILNTTIEVPALHKNGTEFYISLTISPSVQAGASIFIGFLRDITAQRQNRLELEHKTILLEKTNKELEQYAWLTSHDLKEPVRKVLTYSDALLKKMQPGEELSKNYLNKIHSSASRMSRLIDDVLQYSNLLSEQELFEQVDLNKILIDVLDDLEVLIETREAIIETSPLPIIEAVPIQMRQLFQNLISNAIHYARPDTKPVVKVASIEINGMHTLSFSDNGMGLDMQYATKIFQIFQRLIKDQQHRGTGIGLALCKKIVEVHGGTISVESQVGNGSVFTVVIPGSQASA